MFRLSKGAEYAVRGILHLASKEPGSIAYIDEISRAQDVPRAYLAKIFQTLSRKGYLSSVRGPGGGFALVKAPADITLLEIIEAMEGPIHLNVCLIRAGYCERDKTCPVHDVWHRAQDAFLKFLSECTFSKLKEAGRLKSNASLKETASKKRRPRGQGRT